MDARAVATPAITGEPSERFRWSIERGERLVVAWAMATCFLIGWVAVSMANVSETLFLKRVGVQYLPVVFLVSSLCMVASTGVVSRLAARVDHGRLLVRTLLLLALSLVPLWLLVEGGIQSAYVLLVLASKQTEAIALLVLWVALGDLLNARQAKRLYAPIMAGGTLGAIAGSFGSGFVARVGGVAAPLPIAAGGLALAAVLALAVERVRPFRVRAGRRARRDPAPTSALPMLRGLWRDSRLFRLLAVGTLLSGVLGPMLYFQFSYVTDQATRGANGEQRLLALYSAFRGFLNIGVLAIQLLGTTAVFRRIGVPLAATLSPLVYLIGFFGIGVRLDVPAGIGAVTGASLQDHAIFDPAMKVLTTLFREQVRPAVTALIDGPIRRLGGALGNVVIIGALAVGSPPWVGLLGLPIAAVWLVVTLALWRIYPTLLLEATSIWPIRPRDSRPLAELIDRRTVRALEARLLGDDLDGVRVACDLVAESPGAIGALARAARRAPAPNVGPIVAALHRVLEARGPRDGPVPGAARELEMLLADRDGLDDLTRARVVQAYADLASGEHPGTVLSRFADDPSPAVRLVVRARNGAGIDDAALGADDPTLRRVALEEVRRATLASDTAAALRAELIAWLAKRLPDDEHRARVVETFADMAVRHGEIVAPYEAALLAFADDEAPRVRAAVVRYVGRMRLASHLRLAVARLGSDDAAEAAAARDAVCAFGLAAVQPLLDGLAFGGRAIHDAALPILHDMRLDERALRGLVAQEIADVRTTLLRYGAIAGESVPELVLQRLSERIDEGIHTILLLLAVLFHEDRIAEIGLVLVRARDRRTRAVLAEALDALLPDAERVVVVPLLEEPGTPDATVAAASALGRDVPSFDAAMAELREDDDPMLRLLLAAPAESRDDGTSLGPVVLSHVDIILHLRGLDLFAELTTRQLAELAHVVHEESYPAGHAIVREEEFGDQMYVIVQGLVSVRREERTLATLGPGEFFGEMSLFDGETRSATGRAETAVRVMRLDRHDLLHVMEEHPGIAIAVCQTLSRRVRDLIEKTRASRV
jgi:CRP-like cAMP-binding protein/ATP/ADP translocase